MSLNKEEPICRLSPPDDPHTLSRRAYTKPSLNCFAGSCSQKRMIYQRVYYYCITCDVDFHDDCYLWPRKMTHPYHPQHPLVLSVVNFDDPQHPQGIICDSNYHDYYHPDKLIGVRIPNPGNIFDHCTWCGNTLDGFTLFYRCSICKFFLDPNCSRKIPLPSISNPKSHHHSLVFLPRPLLHPCDACGLLRRSEPSYACFQCNYVVHQSCIDLPRVIKLTRHPHRLSYTPFLSPTTVSLCRICYKPVDVRCGTYSCNHDDCSYVAHSKCATHKKVWDRKELEWEPEETDETTEDVAPFKKVGDDLIKYFCHEHPLKLEKYNVVRDADKQCQACILHIDSRDFYNCLHCNFYLHEVCANLPRKLDHALHHHTLHLDPDAPQDYKSIACFVCTRKFAGFRYKCSQADCKKKFDRKFQVDFGCILVPDYFTHKSHEHPLFIPITYNSNITCGRCKSHYNHNLQCSECEYVICYKCATIPEILHSRYDEVPLSLCYGEDSDETYWCEICEAKLNPRDWFYTCNKPYITIHPRCVFGDSIYMKSGYAYIYNFRENCYNVEVLSNFTNTRRICQKCDNRCSSYVFFKLFDYYICSCYCLNFFIRKL